MAAASHTAVAPPRTRWAGIVWGAFFATVAALALWILPDESRRTSAVEWASSLDATTGVAMGVLAVGVVLLVAGLSGVLRRAQRRWGGN
jgi:multisubunit Na+/H+ antiporter MnhG subunit